MVRTKRDLERLDVTVAREMLFELLWGNAFGNLAHENVVINDLLWVRAEQVIVERKGTAGLTLLELKVAHFLASELEFVLLRDLHDGGVEWAV